MSAYGYDWTWDARAKNGMGGFVCHIHADEETANAELLNDFSDGLNAKDKSNER